jgi:hypothetical protein
MPSLSALVLSLWHLLSPGAERLPQAPAIARAIETAVSEDFARGYVDAPLEAAVVAVYAARESSLRPGVRGDGGKSCGLLQLRCSLVRGMTLTEQVRLWLRLVHASSLGSVDSSPKRAARRLRIASRLLARDQDRVAHDL